MNTYSAKSNSAFVLAIIALSLPLAACDDDTAANQNQTSNSQGPAGPKGDKGDIGETGPPVTTVAIKYRSSYQQTIPTNVETVIDFDEKVFDNTSNSVTAGSSWKFMTPKSGLYRITAQVLFANTGDDFPVDTRAQIFAFAGGERVASLDLFISQSATAAIISLSGSTLVNLDVNQDIHLTALQTSGFDQVLHVNYYDTISIERAGDYIP